MAQELSPGTVARAHIGVAAAGVLFGTTFVVMQGALEDVGPVPLLAVRFLMGAAVLAPFALRRRPAAVAPTAAPGLWRAGLLCGVALCVGYLFQTIGLQYTSTTASAFVTYLLVVIVPVLAAVVLRRPPTAPTVAGVTLATAGLVLLNGQGVRLGYGELLTLGCAVAFAVHILLLAEFSPRHDAVRLTAIQLFVVGAACLVPGAFLGGYDFSARAWIACAFTAVFASVVAFGLQTWGQRIVGPTRTSLLLMLEPVSAAVLGRIVGERLGLAGWIGAALILAGIAVAEFLHPPTAAAPKEPAAPDL